MIERARALIRDAERIVVLTGAGISAESGVPTFRGSGGLWKSYRAEDLATPEAFRRDPRLVWEWYGWRRDIVRACSPKAAHLALARLATDRPNTLIATQNVDELHRVGGTPDAALIELHGSLFRVRCTKCGWRASHRDVIDASSRETLPQCDACRALARPDIVWFGESLDGAVLGEAMRLASEDLFLTIGTSAVVYPAAGFVREAHARGAFTVEVNLEETPASSVVDLQIRGAAEEILPAVDALL